MTKQIRFVSQQATKEGQAIADVAVFDSTGAPVDLSAPGVGVKSLALTTDADGKVTGGTLTLTDDTTSAITVTTAAA